MLLLSVIYNEGKGDGMDAKFFLKKDIDQATKNLQREFFSILDSLVADDKDNLESLKEILQDDELAKKFQLIQDNKHKLIRKKILDATGEMNRTLHFTLEDCDVIFNKPIQIKGIVK